MTIKKLIKRLGKFFIVLKEKDRNAVKQAVLIVDNGYSSFEHVFSGIKGIKSHFPQAELLVIALEHRRGIIEKEFCNLGFVIPTRQLYLKRYRIALQMLRMRRRRFDFILLFSLDLSPLIVSLFLVNSRAVLYNQWGQWWFIRLRNISELFKITYAERIKKFSFKSLFKKIGLFFVLLQQNDTNLLKHSVLIVDNGYASYQQIYCSIERTKESLPQARITVLTSREELKNKFPALELIEPEDFIFKKYRIANAMLSLNNRYDYVILLSLDITPLFVSFLFMNNEVLLYNKWHQWWSLKPKPLKQYVMVIPRFIFNSILFIYLLISVFWIFLKKSFNVFKFNLSGKGY